MIAIIKIALILITAKASCNSAMKEKEKRGKSRWKIIARTNHIKRKFYAWVMDIHYWLPKETCCFVKINKRPRKNFGQSPVCKQWPKWIAQIPVHRVYAWLWKNQNRRIIPKFKYLN